MTPKEYLAQYGRLNREIDRLLEEKARWFALAARVTPSLSEEPKGGGGGDRLQLAVEKIEEVEDKINTQIDRLIDLRREIEGKLSTLPDSKQKEVLHRRYILGQKWEEIAVQMDLDYRWILRIHGKALLQLTIESHP